MIFWGQSVGWPNIFCYIQSRKIILAGKEGMIQRALGLRLKITILMSPKFMERSAHKFDGRINSAHLLVCQRQTSKVNVAESFSGAFVWKMEHF